MVSLTIALPSANMVGSNNEETYSVTSVTWAVAARNVNMFLRTNSVCRYEIYERITTPRGSGKCYVPKPILREIEKYHRQVNLLLPKGLQKLCVPPGFMFAQTQIGNVVKVSAGLNSTEEEFVEEFEWLKPMRVLFEKPGHQVFAYVVLHNEIEMNDMRGLLLKQI